MPTTIHVTDQGNQNISGNKNFYGDVLLSGSNNRIGQYHYIDVDSSFVFIRLENGTPIFSSEEYLLFGNDGFASIAFNDKLLYTHDGVNTINSIDWGQRYLANQNGTPVLYWTGDNIGIGTNNPSEKLQVVGNLQVSGTGIFNAIDLNNIDNLSLSGVDVTITSGVISLTNPLSAPNIVYNTGNQTISGVKTFANSGIFSLSGIVPLNVLNNPLSVVGSGNSYVQVNIQNRATGTIATADLVITANNGTDSANFINLGINNSGYNDPTFSNGSGLDGYLFINGGSLDIGTATPNTQIEFHVGGTTAARSIATVSSSGLNIVSGNLRVGNTGVLLSGQNSFIINLYNDSATQGAGNNFFGNISAAFSSTAAGVNRRFPILEPCVVKRATWTQFVQTTGVPSLNSTGYFINTTTTTTGIISTTINTQSTSTPTHYIAEFSPPITISSGDYIVCNLFGPTYATTFPATVRNSVNLYCYN